MFEQFQSCGQIAPQNPAQRDFVRGFVHALRLGEHALAGGGEKDVNLAAVVRAACAPHEATAFEQIERQQRRGIGHVDARGQLAQGESGLRIEFAQQVILAERDPNLGEARAERAIDRARCTPQPASEMKMTIEHQALVFC